MRKIRKIEDEMWGFFEHEVETSLREYKTGIPNAIFALANAVLFIITSLMFLKTPDRVMEHTATVALVAMIFGFIMLTQRTNLVFNITTVVGIACILLGFLCCSLCDVSAGINRDIVLSGLVFTDGLFLTGNGVCLYWNKNGQLQCNYKNAIMLIAVIAVCTVIVLIA